MSAIGIGAFTAESSHLHLQRFASDLGAEHLNDAETCSDGDRATEQTLHFLRPGIRGHVVIMRRQSQQHVADTTARPVRFVTSLA
ncbi:hypothetical protein HRbin36_02825 [bacterium HR36]|nr:hypothetical protein HRbin36_02825 [bacterium HR36]